MLAHLLWERSLCCGAPSGGQKLRRTFFRRFSFETIFTFARIAVRQCQGQAHPAVISRRVQTGIGNGGLDPGRKWKGLTRRDEGGQYRKFFRAAQTGQPKTTKPPRGGSSFTSSHLPNWKIWSGRRDSNPRPRPWQGRALPLSYTRIREIAAIARRQRAELCQMRPTNATVWRRFGIGRLTARLDRFHRISGNPGPIRSKSARAGFPPIANRAFNRQLSLGPC
jgi:hypothetical protein